MIKLTIGLIIGILLAFYKPIAINLSIYLTLCALAITLACNWLTRKSLKTPAFGICAFISIISIGIFTTTLHDELKQKHHFSKLASLNTNKELLTLRIREVLKPTKYHYKYIAEVLKVNDKKTTGKLVLNIEQDSLNPLFKVDDILLTKAVIKELSAPKNPEQFNYKAYLNKKYLYHEITTKSNYLLSISSKKHSPYGYAAKLRDFIEIKLKKHNFKTAELAIINALILGKRRNISAKILDNYAKAGAIHILAVSGLHVGILLLIISALLKPLNRVKSGNILKIIITILFLWSFAIITGLSASVTRAVTMFSIITLGFYLKRPTHIYNTLTISIFILLLFKPLLLFDVGFQLSYSAVIAIVSIQPKLANYWNPKWWILKKVWQITSVSIAAQIGVFPLSLYYFHQFPGLFLVSNLIILPGLGILLGVGVLVIALALLNLLPDILSSWYGFLIKYLNVFIEWIALQDAFIFQNIPFGTPLLIASYFVILFSIRFLFNMKYNRFVCLAVSLLIFQCVMITKQIINRKNEFIIFHNSKSTLLVSRKNNSLKAYSNTEVLKINKKITPYIVSNSINKVIHDSLSPIYTINNRKLLIIDSLGIYNVKRFHPDYLLLINSPKINLGRLIDSLQPSLIIADGSNYKSEILRWKKTCKNKKTLFHSTYEKGAFVIK